MNERYRQYLHNLSINEFQKGKCQTTKIVGMIFDLTSMKTVFGTLRGDNCQSQHTNHLQHTFINYERKLGTWFSTNLGQVVPLR